MKDLGSNLRLPGGDLLVYTGGETDDITYWKAGKNIWITKEENEPHADYNGNGIPNWHTCDLYAGWNVTPYNGSDQVSHNGSVYQCKPWPFSGWCGVNTAYEPGRGMAWQEAWTYLADCEELVVDDAPLCSELPTWALGSYTSGDQVASVGNVYECKGWAYEGWCGASIAYEPGIGWAWMNAWNLVSQCY